MLWVLAFKEKQNNERVQVSTIAFYLFRTNLSVNTNKIQFYRKAIYNLQAAPVKANELLRTTLP